MVLVLFFQSITRLAEVTDWLLPLWICSCAPARCARTAARVRSNKQAAHLPLKKFSFQQMDFAKVGGRVCVGFFLDWHVEAMWAGESTVTISGNWICGNASTGTITAFATKLLMWVLCTFPFPAVDRVSPLPVLHMTLLRIGHSRVFCPHVSAQKEHDCGSEIVFVGSLQLRN